MCNRYEEIHRPGRRVRVRRFDMDAFFFGRLEFGKMRMNERRFTCARVDVVKRRVERSHSEHNRRQAGEEFAASPHQWLKR